MIDYAVVGSGIGGSTIAAYLDAKGFETVLFEKEPYLGGCSSSFSHGGFLYNTGATTLVGYQEGHHVKSMFDAIGFVPDLIPSDPSIVIVQNGKVTPRYKNFEAFLSAVKQNYPHPKHDEFWSLVKQTGEQFYAVSGYYYSNRALFKKCVSLMSYLPLMVRFQRYLRTDAYHFIKDFYGEISREYMQFLEAQILIVAQAPSGKINFLTAALSLGYTFNETHYVFGGFSRLFDQMTSKMKDVRRKTEIKKIAKEADYYALHTNNETVYAKNVILNTTVYDSAKLFDNQRIKKYYETYEKLDNHQSSFMLYMTIKSEKKFQHHYQLIQNEPFVHTLSSAVFVSFSDPSDTLLCKDGYRSITASIHTDTRWWEEKETYNVKKNALKDALTKSICDMLDIKEEQIVHRFAATPKTFKRYINRSQLGGNAVTMENFLPKLPGNDTPIKGLYHVGDTVYAAQGWPGVMLGVENLRRLLYA